MTIRNETSLHIALKYDNLKAFELLVGWLQKNMFKNDKFWGSTILNSEDEEDNTVLHVAVSKKQPCVSTLH